MNLDNFCEFFNVGSMVVPIRADQLLPQFFSVAI